MRIISYCSGCHKLSEIVRIESNVTKKGTVFDLSDLVDKSMTHDVFEISNSFEKKKRFRRHCVQIDFNSQ